MNLYINHLSNTLCVILFHLLFRWGRQIWILLAISVIKLKKSLSICMQTFLLLTICGGGQLYCCNWILERLDQVTNRSVLSVDIQWSDRCVMHRKSCLSGGDQAFCFLNFSVLVYFSAWSTYNSQYVTANLTLCY